MLNRVVTVCGAGLLFTLTAVPAYASIVQTLPEPATMSLFGVAAAGAFVAKKVWGRK